ncbi:MAG: 5-histidylcysteine sulfoxide synthase [Phycisphaerae bacterium]|nr:5-histidylcysteine sulfoxide synthase [Phycisphaerae bacterium]
MRQRPINDSLCDKSILNTKMVILNSGEPQLKRQEILDYFHKSFDLDEAIYQVLKYDETFFLRADPLRHPLIFYYGHTSVFYINKLIIAKIIDKRINPRFESIFAVGVDEMSWDDLNEQNYDWPTVDEVQQYRNQVRNLVDELIKTMPLDMPINWDSPWWAIMMGIEHSRIHIETSSVLIRQLPLDQLRQYPLWQKCQDSGQAPQNELIDVEADQISLGKDFDAPLYGWDNEYGQENLSVDAFKASKYLVSNQEFLEFIEDGGYDNQKLWTEEGWQWRQYAQVQYPRFWRKNNDNSWLLRTFINEIPMAWNWPVDVNYLEAKAFCNWKTLKTGKPIRLPAEEEHQLLRQKYVQKDQPYWKKAPGNINLEHYASSCPVDKFAFGDFYDIIGNVWQWTETPINGLHGFKIHPIYDDFSTPTFDSRHNIIKGGSWISTGNESISDSRYAFRRHFYQHAGLRYVQSDKNIEIRTDHYESNPIIAQNCEFHYGPQYFNVDNYPKTIANIAIEAMGNTPKHKALDIGCSAGRCSFELANAFDHVTGLDFSARSIKPAVDFQKNGYLQYILTDEGQLISYHQKQLEDFDFDNLVDKVEFFQADPSNLKSLYTGYDLILTSNLTEMYDPQKFLETIHTRIKPGGLFVLASSYSWNEDFTEKTKFLGGFRKDGEPYTAWQAITDILKPYFGLIGEPQDIQLVKRDTSRKFQHEIAQVAIFKLK